MNQVITLLKTKSVQHALLIAVLSVLQGFVFELPLTPVEQMIAGIVLAVFIVLYKDEVSTT
jgi:hypothetical protein